MELFIDPGQRRGITPALYGQIREAIVSGRLAHGERLPPTRDLAQQLGISRHTVTTVYGRLVAEGYLGGRAGGGTSVSYLGPLTNQGLSGQANGGGERGQPATSRAAGALAQVVAERSVEATPLAPPPPPGGIDLRVGRPDPRLFPVVAWRRCVVSALQAAPAGGSPPSAGVDELRRVLARWVWGSRGVAVESADLVVTAGCQHVFDLAARLLLRPGDTVAMEDPGYASVRRLFQALGLQVAPVPVDDEGLVVDAVDPAARLVYVSPSHQSPTGVTMSLRRRRELLELADRQDLAIFEDDYDSEFRHTDRPLEPLYKLDCSGRVFYVNTFSKALAPSFKLGFAALPPGLAEPIAAMIDHTGAHPPLANQQALYRFLSDGHLDRHLRRARRAYAERHAVVARWVDEMLTAGHLHSAFQSHCGLHVTCRLPVGVREDVLIAAARDAGLALSSLADSWANTPRWEGLTIGFGCADPSELSRALPLLTNVLIDVLAT